MQEQQIRDQQAQLGVLGAGRAGVQLAEFQTGSDRDRAALQAQLLSSVLVKHNKQHNKH